MNEPKWLCLDLVREAHRQQLNIYGGIDGVKEGGLQSAVERPQNLFYYGTPDMPTLAAAYAYGIIQNHPFSDGNKRAAFISALLFLWLNGIKFVADYNERYDKTLQLAAGEISEEQYADWIRENCR